MLRILATIPVWALAVFSMTRPWFVWWPGLILSGVGIALLWRQEIESLLDWTVYEVFGLEREREEIPELQARHADDWNWPSR